MKSKIYSLILTVIVLMTSSLCFAKGEGERNLRMHQQLDQQSNEEPTDEASEAHSKMVEVKYC